MNKNRRKIPAIIKNLGNEKFKTNIKERNTTVNRQK
jgi:dissimilatory sulfite reductase (desulfoviridin) alpha/beta subunit